jgi:hypothetical protein
MNRILRTYSTPFRRAYSTDKEAGTSKSLVQYGILGVCMALASIVLFRKNASPKYDNFVRDPVPIQKPIDKLNANDQELVTIAPTQLDPPGIKK